MARSAEAGDQLRRAGAKLSHVVELDVFIAANDVRQIAEGDRRVVGGGRERAERPLDEPAVLADERALLAPHPGIAEDVERRAAQSLHRAERLESRPEPGAQPDLLLEPERAQEWRVQVPVVAHPGAEPRVKIR